MLCTSIERPLWDLHWDEQRSNHLPLLLAAFLAFSPFLFCHRPNAHSCRRIEEKMVISHVHHFFKIRCMTLDLKKNSSKNLNDLNDDCREMSHFSTRDDYHYQPQLGLLQVGLPSQWQGRIWREGDSSFELIKLSKSSFSWQTLNRLFSWLFSPSLFLTTKNARWKFKPKNSGKISKLLVKIQV